MARLLAFFASLIGFALAAPATAQTPGLFGAPIVFVSSPVVQPIQVGQRFVSIAVLAAAPRRAQPARALFPRPNAILAPAWHAPVIDRAFRDYRRSIAQFGPFIVLDEKRAALVGETDERTPDAFRAMMRAYPGLAQLDMVECPGTRNDQANMQLGRLIRSAQMVTHVPPIGSVRSGAVELFLAGVERDISDGAEFAVHSWRDEYGREAQDFADDAPENRQYIEYYREMGMADGQARAFYAMTNSVPHHSARWMDAADMRGWLAARSVKVARKAAEPKFETVSMAPL